MRLIAVTMIAFSATTAIAADAPPKPTMVRGTIEKFDQKTITIKADDGTEVTAAVSLASRFATVEKRSVDQIKPTEFVGITAVPGKNGHLSAEEIHVIPLAGMGEGQYPWEHHPSGAASGPGSMTNGTVMASNGNAMTAAPKAATPGSMTNGTVGAGGSASQLNVTFHGAGMVNGKCEGLAVPGQPGCTGTAVVDVAPTTPIVAIVPWRRDMVKPGVYAVATVYKDPAGKATLGSITVEKNGVKPEF